jgi:hypothetical protein
METLDASMERILGDRAMEAEIVDLGSIRSQRETARRRVLESFGRLPCPCCDTMTEASEVASGYARFVCDGGGTHSSTDWRCDGQGLVVDHNGHIRKFFRY